MILWIYSCIGQKLVVGYFKNLTFFKDDADWQLGANANFFSFVFSLLVVRLYYLGRYFISSAYFEPIIAKPMFMTRDVKEPFFTLGQYACFGEYCISTGHLAFSLLCGLWLLHLNWFFRALQVLIAALKNSGNVKGDNRYEEIKDV
jgi:hypothetical protein